MKFRKGYSEAASGQIHWRVWGGEDGRGTPDLYCFHPAPFSGLAFADIGPLLAKNRRVMAPDYPGYGGSSAMDRAPSISSYAVVLAELIEAVSAGRQVDLLGFHSGCLVAAELAITRPELCRELCLIDVPAFGTETAADLAETFSKPFEIRDDLSAVEPIWEKVFLKRKDLQGREDAFAMFVEQLKPGIHMNEAFYAAFSYDWQERFPKISVPTSIFATQSSLLEYSRDAAKVMPNVSYVEDLTITQSVLNASADQTAKAVLKILERKSENGQGKT